MDKANYWLDLAKEDLDAAHVLLNSRKLLHFGFLCHLAVEKALKAKIESVGAIAPKIHNLNKLAELGGLLDILAEEQTDLLDVLNPLQIEVRYPAYKQQIERILSPDQCRLLMRQTEELVTWIEQQL
ncbi:MAG: HEPN domain-containing protein [Oscillospiraceae bacterium]|nr:HEPN domain-containing protein [Oscillospiraceae bacterium]